MLPLTYAQHAVAGEAVVGGTCAQCGRKADPLRCLVCRIVLVLRDRACMGPGLVCGKQSKQLTPGSHRLALEEPRHRGRWNGRTIDVDFEGPARLPWRWDT